MKKRFLIWLRANFTNQQMWKVSYPDEDRNTHLLRRGEAKGLAECFDGKAYIDYESFL